MLRESPLKVHHRKPPEPKLFYKKLTLERICNRRPKIIIGFLWQVCGLFVERNEWLLCVSQSVGCHHRRACGGHECPARLWQSAHFSWAVGGRGSSPKSYLNPQSLVKVLVFVQRQTEWKENMDLVTALMILFLISHIKHTKLDGSRFLSTTHRSLKLSRLILSI